MTGDVETVLVRGTIVVDGGEVHVAPGHGQYVARARFGEEGWADTPADGRP